MKADRDGIRFESGKHISANNGIVGISLCTTSDLCDSLFTGYAYHVPLPEDDGTTPDEDRLTSEECVELANEMLGRWFTFRERYIQTTCHHCGKVTDKDWAREHDNLCIVCSAKQNGPDK